MTTQPISYSRASTFLACRKLFDFRYLQRLAPRVDAIPLTRGKFVDHGLEAAIRAQEGGAGPKDCERAAADEIGKRGQEWLASDDVKDYIELAGEDWRNEAVTLVTKSQLIAIRVCEYLQLGAGRWETLTIPNPDHDPTDDDSAPYQLGVQAKVVGRLRANWQRTTEDDDPAPVDFLGYVDWLARDTRTGQAWLIDFKVRKQLQDETGVEYDYQLPAYQACVRQMGGPMLHGAAHLQIRAAVPKEPAMLKPRKKDGISPGLSRAQIATDWATYRDTVIRHGFDPTNYLDVEAKLKPFDVMTTHYRGANEISGIWAELRHVEGQIKYFTQAHEQGWDPVANRRMHVMQCRGCNFQELCMSELRGHDSEHVKQTHFKKLEYRYANTSKT